MITSPKIFVDSLCIRKAAFRNSIVEGKAKEYTLLPSHSNGKCSDILLGSENLNFKLSQLVP